MQLDKFTDYALRTLIALAVSPAERLSAADVARMYDLSEHHLAKVAGQLARDGFVISERGRGGGLRLAKPIQEISIGAVVRAIKEPEPVVECFGSNKSCKILPACGLRGPLRAAKEAFFAELDRHTLADVVTDRMMLASLLEQPVK